MFSYCSTAILTGVTPDETGFTKEKLKPVFTGQKPFLSLN